VTALVVALLGSTPLGHAARKLVPPYAKQAGYAKFAGTADNSKRLAGHKASVTPAAGDVPVLGPDGKLPSSIGTVGQKGDKGEKGDKGQKGDAATSLWAVVDYAGNKISLSSGVTGTSRIQIGYFKITFDRDVSKCALLATQSTYGNAFATASPSYGADPKSVSVGIYAPNLGATDANFALAVFC
jgi:hypothetical protein